MGASVFRPDHDWPSSPCRRRDRRGGRVLQACGGSLEQGGGECAVHGDQLRTRIGGLAIIGLCIGQMQSPPRKSLSYAPHALLGTMTRNVSHTVVPCRASMWMAPRRWMLNPSPCMRPGNGLEGGIAKQMSGPSIRRPLLARTIWMGLGLRGG